MARHLTGYDISICGLRELAEFEGRGVTHVLSILDPDWPDPEDFSRYTPHRRTLLRFHDVVEPNPAYPETPDHKQVEALLRFGEETRTDAAEHVLIHCHAGVSRSTASAVILMSQFNAGKEIEAFRALHEIRPRCWPNSWLIRLADEILDRRGVMVEALRAHHAEITARHPDLVALIQLHGRAHEVPDIADMVKG